MDTPPASGSSDPSAPKARDAVDAPRRRFGRALRIRGRSAFKPTMDRGGRAGDDLLRVWARENGLPQSRLGLVIGRRHGNAARRNRLKRLTREAFRLVHAELPPGLDILCSPHIGVTPTLKSLRTSLPRLVALAAKRMRN